MCIYCIHTHTSREAAICRVMVLTDLNTTQEKWPWILPTKVWSQTIPRAFRMSMFSQQQKMSMSSCPAHLLAP